MPSIAALIARSSTPTVLNPATLSGKRLWLRAKDNAGAGGSAIASWADLSGLGFNGTAAGTPPTIAAASTPLGGKSVLFGGAGNFAFGDVMAAASATQGEIWAVIKSNAPGVGLWAWSSSDLSHYPWTDGLVYEGWGTASRTGFTPTVSVANWRIYHVTSNGTLWTASLDGVVQATMSNIPVFFPTSVSIGSSNTAIFFRGNIAEILVRSQVSTTQEASDISAYLTAEHLA